MASNVSPEIRVSVDVGCRKHAVAIGLSSVKILDEFEIDHRPDGFKQFFQRIEQQKTKKTKKKQRKQRGRVFTYSK